MAPHVFIVRQKPILERKKDKLKKVCRERPSTTHLEPNGALGCGFVSLSSRVKTDVVVARSWSLVVAVVVDSSIVVEGGNEKMIEVPSVLQRSSGSSESRIAASLSST